MRVLDHLETLLYYDGPQLFVAADQLGTKYLCALVEETDAASKYLCLPASNSRLESVASGNLDVREAYDTPEVSEQYVIECTSDDLVELEAAEIQPQDVPQSWLPDPGLYVARARAPDIEIVEQAAERKRAIIHYRMNPPESRDESKITVEHLSQGVLLFQRLVQHAYSRALAELKHSTRRTVSAPENYELEVFAFSPGSFTVQMQSSQRADLVGYVQIVRALEIIDSVSERVDDAVGAVDKVAELGGHFAGAYKRLVQHITQTGTALEYEWSTPNLRASKRFGMSIAQAHPVYEELTKRKELGVVEITLTGRLSKVDKNRGTWRLKSEADQKDYHGSSIVELSGLTIQTQRYEFVCQETLEEDRITGRETTKFTLISFTEL